MARYLSYYYYYYYAHSRLLVFACFVGAILLSALHADSAPTRSKGPFNGKSFQLSSRVFIISIKDGTVTTSSVLETYSMEQERARISYATQSQVFLKTGSFYLDFSSKNSDGIVLHYDNFYKECKRSNLAELYDQFATRNPLPPLDSIGYSSLSSKESEDLIAGPARLLFVIENNQDKMKLVSSDKMQVRNLNCLMYTISETPELGPNAQLAAFYSIELVSGQEKAVPVQVVLSILDSSGAAVRVTVIDYSKFETIVENRPKPADRAHWTTDGRVVFDEFTFRPVSGCSKALFSSHAVDLFATKSPETSRFSFKAKVEFSVGPKKVARRAVVMKSFVAYDARVGSMRYEIFGTNQPQPNGPVTSLKNIVFNFKANRIYHAMQRAPNSNCTVDKVLDLSLEHEHAGKTATTQCVATKISDRSSNEKDILTELTIGRLLAGGDRFVYMGRAQVRGINAKVYETSAGSLPYWLGQPLSYKTNSSEWLYRQPDIGSAPRQTDKRAVTNAVMLYFGEDDASQQLLMIEIYQMSLLTLQVYEKQTIDVIDFIWDLNESPRGDRVTELFSLANVCSEDASVYARVELLLEGEPQVKKDNNDDDDDDLLHVTEARNLALLAGLQDNLRLPAAMIFDLESKLINGPANLAALKTNKSTTVRQILQQTSALSNDNSRQAMLVSFSVAPHIETLAQMMYVGQGFPNGEFVGKLTCVYMRSFEGCFFLSAHRWANIMFGFDKDSKLCCMDLEGSSRYPEAEGPDSEKAFILASSLAPSEIYRIEHRTNLSHWLALDWIRGKEAQDPSERLKFVGAKLNLRGLRSSPTSAGVDGDYAFEVVAIQKEGGKSLAPMAANLNDNMDEKEDDIRQLRLLGFGLPESKPENKRVKPMPLDTNNWSPLSHEYEQLAAGTSSTMSFEQCQAACLTDFECQSFSVCIRNFEVECVISSTSFRSTLALKQLAKLAKETRDAYNSGPTGGRTRLATKVTIDLETAKVELSRHPNCELHHKNFLDLFNGPTNGRQTFSNRRVYPVLDEEDCAQMCVRQNLLILRNDVSQIKLAYSTAFSSSSKSTDQMPVSAEEQSAIHSLFQNHSRAMRQSCKKFFYIERSRLDEKEESEIQANNVIDLALFDVNQIGGYCVLGDRRTDREAQQMIGADKDRPYAINHYLGLQMFTFKAETFFEKQYGVSLKKSPMSLRERQSYHVISTAFNESELADFTLMRSFIESGNNIQDTIYADESKCALVCFLQSWGPWPACRSFDIVIETFDSSRSYHRCKLNSITLHQAVKTEKFDLIENSKEIKMWHYEPRAGFVLDDSLLTGDVTVRELAAQLEARAQQGGKFKLHSIGSSFVVLIAMISGILFGIWLGKQYLSSSTTLTNESVGTQLLNSNDYNPDHHSQAPITNRLPSRTEFINQVDSEGVIPN